MSNVVNLRAHANVPLIPTLVLLDLQQEYTASPRLFSIPKIEKALENCHAALSLARELGLPVAFLRLIGKAPFFNPALSYSHSPRRWCSSAANHPVTPTAILPTP